MYKGQIGLIVLLGLSLVATIVMVFLDSDIALRLALLGALWAAVLGLFLAIRYRKQVGLAEQRADLQREHYEDMIADGSRSRNQLAAPSGASAEEMERIEQMWSSIREELSAIRDQLEQLQDREFGYEPAALRAEARRILEIEREADDAFPYTQTSQGAPSAEAISGHLGSQPSQPKPNPLSTLISERAAQEKTDREAADKDKQPRSGAKSAESKPPKAPETKADEPASAAAASKPEKKAPEFDTSSFHAVRWDSTGDTPVVGDKDATVNSGAHAQPASEAKSTTPTPSSSGDSAKKDHSEPRPHRRRRDENADGVSVAELLKRSRG